VIELEATERAARKSCRKYSQENSRGIISDFSEYLDRVVRECGRSFDPRGSEFARLKSILSQASQITVTTAGALRSATVFVEEILLVGQPRQAAQPRAVPEAQEDQARVFQGEEHLTAHEAKMLARTIMILDAAIRRKNSGASLHDWRVKAPLKHLLRENGGKYLALRGAIIESQHGKDVDFEGVLSELAKIWSVAGGLASDPEHIRTVISGYFPEAARIRTDQDMNTVLKVARGYLDPEAIQKQILRSEKAKRGPISGETG
jgi:hypothetical protein